MPPLLVFLILFVEYSCSAVWNQSNSNCSLLFTVQEISVSDTIATHFPLKLTGYFNTSCDIQNFSAYYKLTPLNVILIGDTEQQQRDDEDTYSMIKLHANRFNFFINQSSTIRLCVLLSDNGAQYLCRQIHIGVNELYDFWNRPMKVFYLVLISLLGTYHILRFLRHKWRKSGKKSKPKARTVVTKRVSIHETKHDTFENEKVNEDLSGDEDEE
ncbi:unnamed protein product [Adineta ricciae]|uniref:Uncharacterized protein n=1 Tax=Adineta ricciae TaxID=249248 RepID=A0A814DSB6_ADIRI|nr:unnamed protein product [Adineta ricciae]CAF0958956.1 unnamed protein product [Adineta ricciae]